MVETIVLCTPQSKKNNNNNNKIYKNIYGNTNNLLFVFILIKVQRHKTFVTKNPNSGNFLKKTEHKE